MGDMFHWSDGAAPAAGQPDHERFSEGTRRLAQTILSTELRPRPKAQAGIGPMGVWLALLVFVYFLI